MKLLITGAWHPTEFQMDDLKRMGYEICLMPDERASLPCSYDEVEAVVCNALFLYHPVDKFTHLRCIQLTSAGYDRVPFEHILSRGIKLYNARGVYSIPMAEFALSSVLAIYKNTDYFREMQVMHRWEKHRRLRELFGKRVSIIGCGSVGTECAKRFSAMGCQVVGIDVCPRRDEHYERIGPLSALKDAFAEANIVILTVPLTEETRHLVGRDELSSIPEGGVLLNLSRGGIVDTEALVEVLKQRQDLMAVLDVFEEEPLLEENPLWDIPNVVITPHNSFIGDGNSVRLGNLILTNLGKENNRDGDN